MIKIVEFLPATPSPLWTLITQVGVKWAVGTLPHSNLVLSENHPWDYMPLLRLKQRYEEAGFMLAVIESRPPLNKTKRGLPGLAYFP